MFASSVCEEEHERGCTHGHRLVCRASLHLQSGVNKSANAQCKLRECREQDTDLVVHAAPLLALSALERVRLGLLRRGGLRLEQVLGDELAVLGFPLFRRHVLGSNNRRIQNIHQSINLASQCPAQTRKRDLGRGKALTLGSISYNWTMLISPLTTSSRNPGLLAAFRFR